MKALIACAALLSLGAVDSAYPPIPQGVTNGTYTSAGTPPVRFQGEAVQVVLYVNDVGAYCGAAPKGKVILACTKFQDSVAITILPNPCAFDDEYFAHIACHEKGHVLGWPAYHGD
jgi:hypothetical protein